MKNSASYLKKEIRRLKKEVRKMKTMVDYDQMIHFVLNRRGLNSRISPIMREIDKNKPTKRKSGLYSVKKIVCVFIDIDRFKKINDILGYDMGDKTLMLLGKILKNKFRGTDLVCRWGGDEFVVIIFNSDKTHAGVKMKEIVRSFEKSASKIAPRIKPTISYGIAYLSENIKGDLHELIKISSGKMKENKARKKIGRI